MRHLSVYGKLCSKGKNMTKKQMAILSVSAVVAVLLAGFVLYIWLFDDATPPKIPTKSSAGSVVLTSRGCCFWAEEVTVYILDDSGSKATLISAEAVYEFGVYRCRKIPSIDTPITVGIDFVSHYSDVKHVSLVVGEFQNTDEMLRNGLLLTFGDGDLTVISGEARQLYRDGVFGKDGDEWYREN